MSVPPFHHLISYRVDLGAAKCISGLLIEYFVIKKIHLYIMGVFVCMHGLDFSESDNYC